MAHQKKQELGSYSKQATTIAAYFCSSVPAVSVRTGDGTADSDFKFGCNLALNSGGSIMNMERHLHVSRVQSLVFGKEKLTPAAARVSQRTGIKRGLETMKRL